MAASKTRVFLSYAADDVQTARQLADGLRDESFEVWTAESVVPGDVSPWEQAADALGHSDAMVVLLTPRSVASKWVWREVEYALSSERFKHRLIPVVIGGERAEWLDKAPWVLRHLHMVSSASAAKASKQVANALKKVG